MNQNEPEQSSGLLPRHLIGKPLEKGQRMAENATELSFKDRIRAVKQIPLSSIVLQFTELGQLKRGERVGICPFHDEKTPSFHVNDQKGKFYCFGCQAHGDIIAFLTKKHGINLEAALDRLDGASKILLPVKDKIARRLSINPQDDGGSKAAALKIWQASAPIQGSKAETYLQSRGITIPLPPTLRSARLKHETGQFLTGMVGAITVSPSSKVTAIHRTFLVDDGRKKAPLRKPRMMLGPCKGGAVRLAPITDGRLAIAEGIETALSVMQLTGWPVWAALSDGGIESLILPSGLREVIIFADNDSNGVGQEAANRAALKWAEMGIPVSIKMPVQPDTDFNDILLSGKGFFL